MHIKNMQEKSAETDSIRNRILVDVNALYQSVPARNRGLILSTLAVETQKIFDQGGSPKVGHDGGCIGQPGGGITASDGGITVKLCVMGSLDEGIQGGGIEVSSTC